MYYLSMCTLSSCQENILKLKEKSPEMTLSESAPSVAVGVHAVLSVSDKIYAGQKFKPYQNVCEEYGNR